VSIPRVRVTDVHEIVWTGDPAVKAGGESTTTAPPGVALAGSRPWCPRGGVTIAGPADIVRVHPLGGPALRAALGADRGDREWALVEGAVVGVNGLEGAKALDDLQTLPVDAFVSLATYVLEISGPIVVKVEADSGAAPAGFRDGEHGL
jgi:hypothetical protein